jgi:hypothetical protein
LICPGTLSTEYLEDERGVDEREEREAERERPHFELPVRRQKRGVRAET